MKKIPKIIFWGISMLMFFEFFCKMDRKTSNTFFLLILAIIMNPFFLDKICARIGAKPIDYGYALKVLFTSGVVLISFLATMIIFRVAYEKEMDINVAMQDFESIFKIVTYAICLFVLFINKREGKFLKYIVFGTIYAVGVVVSFSSESLKQNILNILNYFSHYKLDMASYELLINDFLSPIKEAILTYIIFDTIISKQSKTEINSEQFNEELSTNNKTEIVQKLDDFTTEKAFEIKVIDKENNVISYDIRVHKH